MENNATCEKKEKPNLYMPEWYRETVKDLMESFEGTSTSTDLSAEQWGKIEIERMLY